MWLRLVADSALALLFSGRPSRGLLLLLLLGHSPKAEAALGSRTSRPHVSDTRNHQDAPPGIHNLRPSYIGRLGTGSSNLNPFSSAKMFYRFCPMALDEATANGRKML